MEKTKPTWTVRVGKYSASLFEREATNKQGNKFVSKSINLQKVYNDDKGEICHQSISVNKGDLMLLRTLLNTVQKKLEA